MSFLAGILWTLSLVILLTLMSLALTIRFWKRRKFEARNKYLLEQAAMQSQTEIQEQTFKLISEEIHDNIGQILSLVKLNLATMNSKDDPALKVKIDECHQLVCKTIHSLRNLSHTLSADYVTQLGLLNSIKREVSMVSNTGAMEVKLDVYGQPYELDDNRQLILFRVFQESMNNILKHAAASLVSITVRFEPSHLILSIKDNGNGFDWEKVRETSAEKGIGLKGIVNKAGIINARLQIKSVAGVGTEIILECPVIQTVLTESN